jgi:lipopolysaccharide export system permease protein
MYFRTGITKFQNKNTKKLFLESDTITFKKNDTLLTIFKAKHQKEIVKLALNNLKSSIQAVNSKNKDYLNKEKQLNKYEIALHEKYALAVTCIILFFVGAPLGAIIRKGGLGLPLVIAIVLFLTYHFIGIFAKNSAEDGTLIPYIAAWISTLIMLPLGIWLTHKATTDQGIIDLDGFVNRVKKIFKKKDKDIPKNS